MKILFQSRQRRICERLSEPISQTKRCRGKHARSLARVSAVYLSGALTGSLLTSVSDPWSYLLGASGGVYAVMMAHLPTLVLNWKETRTFVEWIIR